MALGVIESEDDDCSMVDAKNCRYTDSQPSLWNRICFGNLHRVSIREAWRNFQVRDLNPLRTNFTAKTASERIMRLINKTRLQQENIHQQRSNTVCDNRCNLIPEEVSKINMIGIVIQAYWPFFLLAFSLTVVESFVSLIPSALIGQFYDFLSNSKESSRVGYQIALFLIVAQLLQSTLKVHAEGILFDVGIKCRSGILSIIYQKILRLSPQASKEFSTGEIVNMISIDVENITWFVIMSVYLFSGPLSILLSFILMYQYIGCYCLAGAASVFLFIPFGSIAAAMETTMEEKVTKKKDERVELLTEVVNNAKAIKLHAWENSFIEKIQKLRHQESDAMCNYVFAGSMFAFAWSCYSFLTMVAALSSYLFLNKGVVLDPKKILVSMSYFGSLKEELINLPTAVSCVAKCVVSMKRIKRFLAAYEVDLSAIGHDLDANEVISLKNATLSWGEGHNPVLSRVSLTIFTGELVAVIGSVGGGKSSLLQSIIGEMKLIDGSIDRKKSSTLAYVAQQAWILNDTIKSNILFGSRLNPITYQNTVNKSCLVHDLKIMPSGDETKIGDKGLTLSGGQKQRVSLARAIYQDADIYLLDDPLSAVDAQVAQSLFNDVIGRHGVLCNKTRLLVTHTLSVLPQVDRVVVLEAGKITHQGTYSEIVEQKLHIGVLLDTRSSTEGSEEPQVEQQSYVQNRIAISAVGNGVVANKCTEKQLSEMHSSQINDEEEIKVGKVEWSVYLDFISRFGITRTLATIGGYTMFQLATTGSVFFISSWGEKMKEHQGTTREETVTNMKTYLTFGGIQALSILVALIVLSRGLVRTSTLLHNEMLDAVLKAPLSFFSSTPNGRILNRFCRDIEELGVSLYFTIDSYLGTLTQFIVLVVLNYIEVPQLLSLLIPVVVVFIFIQQLYMRSSRQIKRLSTITKSPVFNSFNETISGVTSIRAYGSQEKFVENIMRLLDNNQCCTHNESTGSRWLAMRLNLLGSFLCGAVVCVLTSYREQVDAVTATLVFNFSMQATVCLEWIVRCGAEVENSLVSVERVLEYTKLQPEASWGNEDLVGDCWPESGEIVFEDYSTQYRDYLDLVLKRINLQISPGEKVGIVGRTGAGKSSLALAMLRIIEATEGQILIDGIDISRIALHTLRSRIAMIPQDPVLFKGSLRYNVDPVETYTDEEVCCALERVHLKVRESGLDYQINEGGANLSVGERQLVCLARALLHNSRVVILDEATASVDQETDKSIQQTIREDFTNSTVLTIAHRVLTIVDYNKIIVMDDGCIAEIGSPQDLLKDPQSLFSSMASGSTIQS